MSPAYPTPAPADLRGSGSGYSCVTPIAERGKLLALPVAVGGSLRSDLTRRSADTWSAERSACIGLAASGLLPFPVAEINPWLRGDGPPDLLRNISCPPSPVPPPVIGTRLEALLGLLALSRPILAGVPAADALAELAEVLTLLELDAVVSPREGIAISPKLPAIRLSSSSTQALVIGTRPL